MTDLALGRRRREVEVQTCPGILVWEEQECHRRGILWVYVPGYWCQWEMRDCSFGARKKLRPPVPSRRLVFGDKY